jgi:protein ImuB
MPWAALRLSAQPPAAPPEEQAAAALAAVATWALQYSPRVSLVDEAVLVELGASLRLFGGLAALRARLRREAQELGCDAPAWAPTALAALALARAGLEDGLAQPLPALLAGLPLHVLSAARPHLPTLTRLGCRTLADLQRLPRAGLARRCGEPLLAALDQAGGLAPQAHAWFSPPASFDARLALPAPVEQAAALLFGARRLLLQMTGWLAAQQRGTTAFTLRWTHDALRPRAAAAGGALTVRSARPARELDVLSRLLAEHLGRVALAAPVAALELQVLEAEPLPHASATLWPAATDDGRTLAQVLDRLAVRLGPQGVLRPLLVDDHRPECAQRWLPAAQWEAQAQPQRRSVPPPPPQPSFLLAQPLPLAVHGGQPHDPGHPHHGPHGHPPGPLELLAGPHRIEGGWWHGGHAPGAARPQPVERDYWLARSAHAGLWWVYRQRPGAAAARWFVHGSYA